MIKVNKNENIITISGHANSGEYGKDIVCASVSSMVYLTVNALNRINEKSIDFEDNGIMKIKVLSSDEITTVLIDNLMEHLKSLEKDYPKNLNVKESN